MQEQGTPQDGSGVRADKWLWAVRVFKTRSQAATACRLNQVRVLNQAIKPSRLLRPGDKIEVEQEVSTRTLLVLGLIEKRIGAKRVAEFMEDQTPAAVLEQARQLREQQRQNRVFHRPGEGRPTKKDRRAMDEFEGQDQDPV